MSIKLPLAKPEVIETLSGSVAEAEAKIQALLSPTGYTFNQAVDGLFWWCVEVLKVWGDVTGLGYNLINILIFILLQPALILLFFGLWWSERSRRNATRTVVFRTVEKGENYG